MTRRIPYAFIPQPRRLVQEWRAGRLDDWDRLILDHLYSLVKPGSWEVQISLPRLAEAIKWPYDEGTLSKRVRSLRSRNWLRYDSKPGRHAPVYTFELWHVPGSEDGPSWKPLPKPKAGSEADGHGPTTAPSGPSSSTSTGPAVEPEEASPDTTAVRALKTSQDQDLGFEGGVNNNQRLGTKSASIFKNEEAAAETGDGPGDCQLFDDEAYGTRRGYGQEPDR